MRTTGTATGWPRWARATGGLMTVAVLAACGSSTSSTAPGVAAYDRSATTANTTAMAAAPITTPELAAKLKAGSSKVTSAHVTMSIKVGNKSVLSAEGDETLANGKLSAMRLSEKVGTLNLTIMIVDGNVYVKLPPSLNKSGKPWEKATMGSTNPVLKQLASSISSSQQSASLSQYGSFAQAAVSVRTVGIEQVNGTTSTHESLIVDVTKIHSEAITEAMKTGSRRRESPRSRSISGWMNRVAHRS